MSLCIKELKSKESSFASISNSNIQSSLVAFGHIAFAHTRRLDNALTHNFTKHTRYINYFSVWMKDASPQS